MNREIRRCRQNPPAPMGWLVLSVPLLVAVLFAIGAWPERPVVVEIGYLPLDAPVWVLHSAEGAAPDYRAAVEALNRDKAALVGRAFVFHLDSSLEAVLDGRGEVVEIRRAGR